MKSIYLPFTLLVIINYTACAGFFDFFELGDKEPWYSIFDSDRSGSENEDDNLQSIVEEGENLQESSPQKLRHKLDFTLDYNDSAKDVLKSFGVEVPSFFVSDIDARFSDKGLVIGSKNRGYYGLRSSAIRNFPEALRENPKKITQAKLVWGVERFPQKENWNRKKKRRNSIAIVISFGPKTSEGSPYFIGFVLSKTGEIGRYYVPSRFKKVGRYTIVAHPKEGVILTSDLDLKAYFTRAFGANIAYPGVSGVGIEVDTRNMNGQGLLAALELSSD